MANYPVYGKHNALPDSLFFLIYLALIRSTIPTTIEIKQAIYADCGVIKADPTQILLVDDEHAILTMEKRMLGRLGYQVTSRTSSFEALEAHLDAGPFPKNT